MLGYNKGKDWLKNSLSH